MGGSSTQQAQANQQQNQQQAEQYYSQMINNMFGKIGGLPSAPVGSWGAIKGPPQARPWNPRATPLMNALSGYKNMNPSGGGGGSGGKGNAA
jgi:hypothetical protein